MIALGTALGPAGALLTQWCIAGLFVLMIGRSSRPLARALLKALAVSVCLWGGTAQAVDIDFGRTLPLLRAVQDNDLPALQRALATGASVNATESARRTALMQAASLGRLDMARVLVEYGAEVSLRDVDGMTALHYAAENGHTPVVTFLLERGAAADPPSGTGLTPLMLAARGGHTSTVRELLAAGADPGAADYSGRTVVEWAAKARTGREISRLLQEAGAR